MGRTSFLVDLPLAAGAGGHVVHVATVEVRRAVFYVHLLYIEHRGIKY